MHLNLILFALEFSFLGFFCMLLVIALIILSCQIMIIIKMLPLGRRNRNQESTADDVPPGSRGLPLIGETIQFVAAINSSKGFYDFVQTRCLRYGNCFKTNIFGQTHVFFSSTETAKLILKNDSGKFTKRYLRSIAQLVGDKSLLCASPDHHKLIRHRLNNLFTTKSLSLFIKQFDELIIATLSGWDQDGGTVVVLKEALKITFKAMCKMLMSFESGEVEMMEKDVADVCKAMLAFPLKVPWTRFYNGLQARKRIMKTLEKIITLRRSGLDSCNEDFLQYLVTEDNEDSANETLRLTDTEIQDNILTMIIAGQDTTASAITWMIKYLSENQEVLDAVKIEQLKLAEKLTSTKSSFLTLQDLNNMPYASKVVKESLRMASVVAWFPRLVLQDCEVEGYKIKKGWNVNIVARSIHFDPMVYNDPNRFNPSRFDEYDSKPYSFLAFGLGGRTCLGLNMAKAMMLVFLHRLITTYKWKVIDSDSTVEKRAMFSRLKSGCPIHVTRIPPEDVKSA
ncbi:hypothetical protein Ddye_010062 [Dipteronia dyeriana]|uniref:Cytochrome P450 n=1 Tax=Dipteronia dyeriana TaxID=168575 RepID=A0AAE0CMS9_9ROSI|nr:hypothetical protein Ddye_010062 [Dipteronia dyeriana]